MVRLLPFSLPTFLTPFAHRRMHTNATVTLSNNDKTATLKFGGKTLIATLLLPSTGSFGTAAAERLRTDPRTPTGAANADQPNDGVTVLTIDVAAGASTISVLFK